MTNAQMIEEIIERWVEVQRRAVAATAQNRTQEAIDAVTNFLTANLSPDLQAEVIAFRGNLHEESGQLENARADFLESHGLSSAPSYSRYTVELALGAVCRELGATPESRRWYEQALKTALEGDSISGAAAILGLLNLVGDDRLTQEERSLCESVVTHSSEVLGIIQEDLPNDLRGAAAALIRAGGVRRPTSNQGE
jgi:tetratricopeptide (TPR) repeat protein